MDSTNCIPQDKRDFAAISRARVRGFPALNPILPYLLEWLQDANWPISQSVAELVSSADEEIVPHIRSILSSDDSLWKFHLMIALFPLLQPVIMAQLQEDLSRLAEEPSDSDKAEEVDGLARSYLSLT